MKTRLIRFVCSLGIAATTAAASWGQSQTSEPAEAAPPDAQQEDDASRMPAPLDGVSGNLLDLEKSGHLKVIKVAYSRTKMFDDQAMIWTVEVVKPLTCGRAILLVQEVSDVRFYRVDEDYHRDLFATRLFYDSWLDSGAVSHEILDRDERFDVWMDLTEREAWNLNHDKANRVVFGRPGQVHNVDRSLWKWK